MVELPDYGTLDERLDSLGYSRIDPTSVMAVALADRDFPEHDEVRLADGFYREWIDGFISANRLEGRGDAARKILGGIAAETIVASIAVNGDAVGFGFGALEGDHVGLFDIFVKQDYRGRGNGRKILETVLHAAKAKGAATGYLQVMDNNLPARSLYEALGFGRLYGYWYRKGDAAGQEGARY